MPLQNVDAHHYSSHTSDLLVGSCLDNTRCPVYVDIDNDRTCNIDELRFFFPNEKVTAMLTNGILAKC